MSKEPKASERCYYLAWIDKRTDPWPNWDKIRPGQAGAQLEDRPVEFLPPSHATWPGMPLVRGAEALIVRDGRMGSYPWPGIPLRDGTGRLYVGPTISALFHEGSHRALGNLERAILLFQEEKADGPESPVALLRGILAGLAMARGKRLVNRLDFQPVRGITDPTNYKMIVEAVASFLTAYDPFELKTGKRKPPRVTVNLSAGTPAMATSWLMLWWSGMLGGRETTVDFVQGDGGSDRHDRADNPTYNPLRTVEIDVLARVQSQPQSLPPPAPAGDELPGQPYDVLRREIETAALLGLPVLLEGPRGSGKTFLAQFYHRRRQEYRLHAGAGEGKLAALSVARRPRSPQPRGSRLRGVYFPEEGPGNRFVKVTLSEYADLHNLRNTLFGWAEGAFTGVGADHAYDGLLGEAHEGTLFLDELHHLNASLQPLLLGPLNTDALNERRYQPMNASYEIISDFDLILASNDPAWRQRLLPDLRDRIERVVLQVPSFRDFQRNLPEVIWRAWDSILRRRCGACRIAYSEDGDWLACRHHLEKVFQTNPLSGNWRDLQRLADNVLLEMIDPRGGRPGGTAVVDWLPARHRTDLRGAAMRNGSRRVPDSGSHGGAATGALNRLAGDPRMQPTTLHPSPGQVQQTAQVPVAVAILKTETARQSFEPLGDPHTFEPLDAPGQPAGTVLFRPVGQVPSRRRGVLERVLGSRPAVVLIRLVLEEDTVRAKSLIEPNDVTAPALELLRMFVEDRFRQGREGAFQGRDREWQVLLGQQPAPLCERLLLLTRLAQPGSAKMKIGAKGQASPNNHGLSHYASKFALLPDGMPFSLALLLGGRKQGKKSTQPERANHPWKALPWSVRLLALRHALRQERQEGKAWPDERFRHLLRNAVNALGISLEEALFTRDVTLLREKLVEAGATRSPLFPEATARQQRYDDAEEPS